MNLRRIKDASFDKPSVKQADDETVKEFAKIIETQAAAMLSEGRKNIKGTSCLAIKITPPKSVQVRGQDPIELVGGVQKDGAFYAYYIPKTGWKSADEDRSLDLD